MPANRDATLWEMLVGFVRRLFNFRPVQGYVDSVARKDTVVGWARDSRDDDRHLEVQVLHGTYVAGVGIADLPRQDLINAKVGTGCYGFRIRVAPQFLDGTPRTMTVCAVTSSGKVLLQRGQVTIAGIAPPLSPAGKVRVQGRPAMIGALDRISGNSLHGWAFNPEQPDMPTVIDFYDDERYIGSVTADLSRPRLQEKGFPAGVRGFVFDLPESVQGIAIERLRARIAGTVHELERSKALDSDAPAAAPEQAPAAGENWGETLPLRTEPVAEIADAVALWLVGSGDAGATLTAWAGQRDAAVVLVGAPGLSDNIPASLRVLRAEKDLVREVARQARTVLFCRPGDMPDLGCAALLGCLHGFPDVMPWGDAVRPLMPGDALRLEMFLKAPRGGLAVRGGALLRYPGDLVTEVARGNLYPLCLWLAGCADLRWQQLPPQLCRGDAQVSEQTSPRLEDKAWRARTAAVGPQFYPAAAPGRVSIGLWRDNDDALRALLEQKLGASLDILVPGHDGQGGARLERAQAIIAALELPDARARIVDCGPEPLAVAAALLAAADGDVALLSDGGLPPGPLAPMLAWAMHPHVGAVGPRGLMLGEGLSLTGSGTRPQVVDGVSLCLIAVAPQKVMSVGLPDAQRFADADQGGLEFCLRLRRFGFHSIVLPGEINGGAPGALPWQAAALLRSAGLLG